jgi:hypothetical protein
MSALPKASVVYLPPVADRKFLRNAIDLLDQLRSESEMRGHVMLASLLDIARGEAEDGLNTQAKALQIHPPAKNDDDGAALMAEKLACRAESSA